MGSYVSRRRLYSTLQTLQDHNAKLRARVAELDGEVAELTAMIEALDRVAAFEKAENTQLKANYKELLLNFQKLKAARKLAHMR
jgi:hypothetical protein